MRKRKPNLSAQKGPKERLRQLAWAGLIALALHFSSLLFPLNQALYIFQYAMNSMPVSGETAFIGARDDLTDPSEPQARDRLAQLISDLDRAGAKEIYVDLVFDRPSSPESDAALNQALINTRGRAHLVDQVATDLNGERSIKTSVPEISRGVEHLGSYIWTDFFFGIAWQMYPTSETGGEQEDFSTRLAGNRDAELGRYEISYYFDLKSLQAYRIDELEEADFASLAGKKVVIGAANPADAVNPNMPGHPSVPPSLIKIFAAETLIAGDLTVVDEFTMLLAVFVALALILLIPSARIRYAAYAILCLALPVAMYVTAQLTMLMSPASALFLLLFFAAFRARAIWKRGFKLVDEDTNLPTFAALEADKTVADTVPAIIVAKIHRFEEVRRTLPHEMHAEYVLRIIARLKAATQDATIYLGQGHLIAWTMPEKEPALLKEHLEGLRALFASPLLVGNNQVDVGITFGVDITPSPNVTRRVAAAVSAAEHTNETFEPIAIADGASDEDLIWNISLQARIDAALANGEIYLVYQPKIDVASGALTGVESLVRWNDPAKGHIPPDHFIRQCENAGRMSHLTRHVLTEGCKTGLKFVKLGQPVPVAINISATLIHEHSIVRMVRDVLSTTGFDPRLLVLEITETYRISNLERAAEVLAELKALGTKISMDDFGVGAASLEALLELPFSELKLDRLFISRMTSDTKALGIVQHVLKLGRDMGITVVAEGVEDEQTLNILRDSGCMVAQGFGISRPVSFEEVIEFQRLAGNATAQNGLHFTTKVG